MIAMKAISLLKISIVCLLLPTVLTGCIEKQEKQLPPLSFIDGKVIFNHTVYPDTLVVGMILKNRTSLVYYWNKENNTIDIEMAYTPSSDILSIYQKIISLNLTSPYTGSKIVPYNLKYEPEKNRWFFCYYDMNLYGSLGNGDAYYYPVNQTVSWGIHSD